MKGKLLAPLAIICLMLLVSCGGGGGSGGEAASTGTLSTSLTDAPLTDYDAVAVYITVSQVAAHKEGGDWQIVSSPNKTYNLLALINGVRQELGVAVLPAGHYTQVRLILSSDRSDSSLNILSRAHPYPNYFIDGSGESHELKVPSGFQSGIKIVKGFNVTTNQTTDLVLDFDAMRSIVQARNSGKWLLKPTIKVVNTVECAIVEGNAGQAGVLVSAQLYNSSTTVPEDKVQVRAATVSDAGGNYKLFVEPGSYTLVGYKEGYAPYYKQQKIVTTAGSTKVGENFSLTPASAGTLAGGPVNIPGADQDQYATISVRQAATVSAQNEQIEVKSANVANLDILGTSLPVGSYTAVISTFGKTTISKPPFTIAAGVSMNISPIDF
jgi:hypothetical protein